jgi:PKD repeat protein
MKTAVEALSLTADYTTTNIPDSLDQYSSVFVCLGVYPQNQALSSNDGQKLTTYLNNGGNLYMEGGDTWYYDVQTTVHPMFNILPVADGAGDLVVIQGYSGTFTDGMSFIYAGDNNSIDHISPKSTAFHVFKNQSPVYDNVIANDAGTYKTIGSSFEFGGLTDASYPSTKMHLMEEYLNFFGIHPAPLNANFIGFPTNITQGETVDFNDYSTGGVITWNWSFPGGTPSQSNEKDPVVSYNAYGTYDVQLIVNNGVTSDTMFKQGYIHVDFTSSITGNSDKLICQITPNPTNGLITLKITSVKEDVISIELSNTFGALVFKENNIPSATPLIRTINLSSQPDGIYFLTLKGKTSSITKKIILQK